MGDTGLGLDISAFTRGCVLVIGDVMIDAFVYGGVHRVSPEAPIPVVRVTSEREMPGGAANVASNIAALGGKAIIVGVIGDDEAGRRLQALIQATTNIVESLVVDGARPTTLKTRYIGNKQQVLRVDRECSLEISCETVREIITLFENNLDKADVVALSDYMKGVITDDMARFVIEKCREEGKAVIVDPKRENWDVFRGATLIKPNLQELARASRQPCKTDAEVNYAAEKMAEEFGVAVLLTRSDKGMSLYRAGVDPIHVRANAREVFDVSGAGDTAFATLAISIASNCCLDNAMKMSNIAAGVAVSKRGTATVNAGELLRAWAEEAKNSERIVSWREASDITKAWRALGYRVGFTNGCFDILHAGHVSLLAKAAARCDKLVVGINSDNSVRRIKGSSRPVQEETSRLKVMAALTSISLVTVFEEDSPLQLIDALKPDILFKGADYKEQDVVGRDLISSWGGKVEIIDLEEGFSTTAAIKRAVDQSTNAKN